MGKLGQAFDPRRCVSLAIVALMATFSAPSPSVAETFRSGEFLTWKPASRAAYIEASVGMASLIAAQLDTRKATCIDAWYYGAESTANEEIYATMRRFPDHHPRGVILAFVRKRCDVFHKVEG